MSYNFANSARLWSYAQINLLSGKGKQTERAEQLQHNGNLTEATAAEIYHHLLDPVCAFIEVSVGYRFCYVPNLSFKILYDVV